MSKLLSAFVGASMLGLVGAANAAEPIALTDAQLDGVAAGVLNQNFVANNLGVGQVNQLSVARRNINVGIGKLEL